MPAENNKSNIIIFSDIDGTFLDHFTYSFEPLLPALQAVKDRKIPLIFCSSKTRTEIEVLREDTGLEDPFIVENGGAIFLPKDYFDFHVEYDVQKDHYLVIELGVSYNKLIKELHECANMANVPVVGFADMTVEQISEECGFSLSQAELAKQREYDEPFIIFTDNPAAISNLTSLIEQSGLRCLRGGRFFHITGSNDKGQAVVKMVGLFEEYYGSVFSVGIGDSKNDLEMLLKVHFPVLVKKYDGEYDQHILAQIPNIHLANHIGPVGWNEMVLNMLVQINC